MRKCSKTFHKEGEQHASYKHMFCFFFKGVSAQKFFFNQKSTLMVLEGGYPGWWITFWIASMHKIFFNMVPFVGLFF